MKTVLTFIVPVRHPENTKDWASLKHKLSETMRSISSQDSANWKAVIVANSGSDLPELPHENIEIKYVDFPPNPMFERGTNSVEDFHNAVRLDKGRRVLAGMLHAVDTEYLMVVDDDDFINAGLTSFVKKHAGENGWYINDGYLWTDGGKIICRYQDFSKLCGTSHIIRRDLFELPNSYEAADDQYICKMMGSHVYIRGYLDTKGTALSPLPLCGAMYRMGHAGSHSKSRTILRYAFLNKKTLLDPVTLLRRALSVRTFHGKTGAVFTGVKQ